DRGSTVPAGSQHGHRALGSGAGDHPRERSGGRLDGHLAEPVQGVGLRVGRGFRRRGGLAVRLRDRLHLSGGDGVPPQHQSAGDDGRRWDGQRARFSDRRRPLCLTVAGTVDPVRTTLLYGAILVLVLFFAPGGIARTLYRAGEALRDWWARRGAG